MESVGSFARAGQVSGVGVGGLEGWGEADTRRVGVD